MQLKTTESTHYQDRSYHLSQDFNHLSTIFATKRRKGAKNLLNLYKSIIFATDFTLYMGSLLHLELIHGMLN